MDSKRNSILIEYLQKLGIKMNVCKNKARGNKGYFRAGRNFLGTENFVITISKGMSEDEITRVLVHEFIHYFHYQYDRSLKSIDFFIQQPMSDALHEELINLTVDIVPKEFAKNLFNEKDNLNNEINEYMLRLKQIYPEIQKSKPLKILENKIKKSDFKYLLKYDKVHICGLFADKVYTISGLKELMPDIDEEIILYLKLKSKQRMLRRVNNKISRLNKYYNSCTEMFARSMETYLCDKQKTQKLAPLLSKIYDERIKDFPVLDEFTKLLNS